MTTQFLVTHKFQIFVANKKKMNLIEVRHNTKYRRPNVLKNFQFFTIQYKTKYEHFSALTPGLEM